jgi:hypothetical protein
VRVKKSDLLECPTVEHKRGEPLPVRSGLAMSPYKTKIDGRSYRVFYRLVVRLPAGEEEITFD